MSVAEVASHACTAAQRPRINVCAQTNDALRTNEAMRRTDETMPRTDDTMRRSGKTTPRNKTTPRGGGAMTPRTATTTRSSEGPGLYHSAYLVPLSAVASDPLLTSEMPGSAVGLLGSGSAGTVCQVLALFVNGSSAIFRMYPSLTSASSVLGYCPLSA